MNISINKLSKYFFLFFGLTSSAIFIYNIFSYYSFQAPDGDAHNEYVYYLSIYLPDNLKLPSMSDTYEYFSPPVAYFFPALGIVLCRNLFTSEDYKTDCLDFYDNLGQAFLFFLFAQSIIFFDGINSLGQPINSLNENFADASIKLFKTLFESPIQLIFNLFIGFLFL